MTPEPFKGANAMFHAPEGWPNVAVFSGHDLVVSAWRPTEAEIALLVGGGVLVLTTMGPRPAPTQMSVLPTCEMDAGMAQG